MCPVLPRPNGLAWYGRSYVVHNHSVNSYGLRQPTLYYHALFIASFHMNYISLLSIFMRRSRVNKCKTVLLLEREAYVLLPKLGCPYSMFGIFLRSHLHHGWYASGWAGVDAVDGREGSMGRVCFDSGVGVSAACRERYEPPGAGTGHAKRTTRMG